MFKSATTYKAFLGLSLAFFFGLTLGLTLNLIGSQTSTANRTQAANASVAYCRLTSQNLTSSVLKTCNDGRADEDPPNPNEPPGREDYLGGKGNVVIAAAVNLNDAQYGNPVDTRCSVIQYDGAWPDVRSEYYADANNRCIIHAAEEQSSDDHCTINGIRHNGNVSDNSNLRTLFKNKFDSLCNPTSTPTTPPNTPTTPPNTPTTPPNTPTTPPNTPTPIPPTANFSAACYQYAQYPNLTYKLRTTNLAPAGVNKTLEYRLCMSPSGNSNQGKIYQWIGGADFKGPIQSNGLPSWACYRLGIMNVAGNLSSHDFYLSGEKTLYGKTFYAMTMEAQRLEDIGQYNGDTTYDLRVLVNANGVTNNSIPSVFKTMMPDSCDAAPSITPSITPPAACTWKTTTLAVGDWIGALKDSTKDTTTYTQQANFPRIDKTKDIQVSVDWGWTGKPETDEKTNNTYQRGPIYFTNGNITPAEASHQNNEKSKVEVYNGTSTVNLGTIGCIDVGEYKVNNIYTPFSDGRTNVDYDGNTSTPKTNLQDVLVGGGLWYTCLAGKEPKQVNNAAGRPNNYWVNVDTANTTSTTFRFVKKFDGGATGPASQIPRNKRGSHYTKIHVKWCQNPQ